MYSLARNFFLILFKESILPDQFFVDSLTDGVDVFLNLNLLSKETPINFFSDIWK